MNDTSTVGLGILFAACLLGIFGDALLRAVPWGINLLLWTGMLVAAVAVLVQQNDMSLTGGGRWLVIPILVMAGTVAWHDSLALTAVSVLALLVALGLAAGSTNAGRIRVAGLIDYSLDLILACIYAGVGLFPLIFSDIEWGKLNNTRRSQQTVAAVRGFALAVPLLIVFGGLFMVADAVFENFVLDLIDWDLETIISHLFLFGFVAIGILHFINPDALIARTNVARIDNAPRPFDAVYMTILSADSVPVLVDSLPAMKEDDRCLIAADLLEEWSGDGGEWRSWNWSRWRARQLVSANSDYLEDIACPSRTSQIR